MRRIIVKGRKADGTPVDIVRLEPETEEDQKELRMLQKAGLLNTDENRGDRQGQQES